MTRFLLIPSLFIAVNVYDGKNRQAIVDAEDSAVRIVWGDLTVIADHVHQSGFSRLIKAKPERTRALFIDGKIKTYVCDSTERGFIRLSKTGNRLFTESIELVNEAWKSGLCIYTCEGRAANGIQPVRLTHWRRSN